MKFDEFIGQVQSRARLSSMGDAVKATRAVLETLSERIPEDEANNLCEQLPSEIAHYLRKTSATVEKFGLDDFFKRVSARESIDLPDAVYHSRVVMSVLQDAVSKGEIDEIRDQLPREFDPLFISGAEGEMRRAA